MPTLTERDLDVVRLIACGFTYEEIGAALELSPNTVKTHTTRIKRKLNLKYMDRAGLVGLCFRAGWIE